MISESEIVTFFTTVNTNNRDADIQILQDDLWTRGSLVTQEYVEKKLYNPCTL